MITPTRLARSAGAFYLLVFVFGSFANLGVRLRVRVPGDNLKSFRDARHVTVPSGAPRLRIGAGGS